MGERSQVPQYSLQPKQFCQYFSGLPKNNICEFESSQPSHAVQSLWGNSGACCGQPFKQKEPRSRVRPMASCRLAIIWTVRARRAKVFPPAPTVRQKPVVRYPRPERLLCSGLLFWAEAFGPLVRPSALAVLRFELDRLHDRQVGRLLALENPAGWCAALLIRQRSAFPS
jgi:hypothetical protein